MQFLSRAKRACKTSVVHFIVFVHFVQLQNAWSTHTHAHSFWVIFLHFFVPFSLSRSLSLISFIALAHENASFEFTLAICRKLNTAIELLDAKKTCNYWMNEWNGMGHRETHGTRVYNSQLLPLALKWHWSMSCYQECVCGCTIGNYHYNKFSSISFHAPATFDLFVLQFFFFSAPPLLAFTLTQTSKRIRSGGKKIFNCK